MNGALKPFLVLSNQAFNAGYLWGYEVNIQAGTYQAISAGFSDTVSRREYVAASQMGANESNSLYTDASDGSIVDGVVAYRTGYNSGFGGTSTGYGSPGSCPDADAFDLGQNDAGQDGENGLPNMYTGDSTAWLGAIDGSSGSASSGSGGSSGGASVQDIIDAFAMNSTSSYGSSGILTLIAGTILSMQVTQTSPSFGLTDLLNSLFSNSSGLPGLTEIVQAALLTNPANKLATDAAGKVGVNNLPSDYLSSAEQTHIASADAESAADGAAVAANGAALTALPGVLVAALKADPAFAIMLSHNEGKFTYNPATHALQLLLDDGVTPLGNPMTLTLDSAGNDTQRK